MNTMTETNYTPAQLEAWAGLGPFLDCEDEYLNKCVYPRQEEEDSGIELLLAAPDLARLVLEKDAKIARLKAQIQDIKECWDWWQEDTYDRCSTVVDDAIRQAMKETSDE